jgi:hypothetical protein
MHGHARLNRLDCSRKRIMADLAWTCIAPHLLKDEKPTRGGFCNWLTVIGISGAAAPVLGSTSLVSGLLGRDERECDR